MKRRTRRNVLFTFAVAGGAGALAALVILSGAGRRKKGDKEMTSVPRIPLRDFFRNPERVRYRISPDATRLTYLAPYRSRLNVFVRGTGGGPARRITNDTSRDIRTYFWKGNDAVLYLQDRGGDENFSLFAADPGGGRVRALADSPGVKTEIIDELEDVAGTILIALNRRNPELFDPYRMDVSTGEREMVAENPGDVTEWIADHDGRLRAAIATDGVNKRILYRETEDAPFRTVLTTSFKETVKPLFFTFDNRNVYALSNLGRDKTAVVLFDIAQGREMKVLYANPDYDVIGLSYSRKRKVVTAALYVSWKLERHFFDRRTEEMFSRLERDLGDDEIEIADRDREEDLFVVRTYSDRSLGAYYLYDARADTLRKLADVSPWIEEAQMARMRPIAFTSRDGLTIHGYLTLPVGVPPRGLPVVILVHGGPWARDSWGFNPEVQFLANRGYAVLQVNYRGSTGYGRRFWEASFKQWGRAMQDDLTDAALWLVREGIADRHRIAIYGGSYGGYATLAGLAFTPDLYACGVDYVGVSNLITFMKTIPPYWRPYLEMMHEMVGDPVRDRDLLIAESPVFHVDRIRAPLLIAQGANDPRVNKNESDQMVEALRRRGVPVDYMVKENEGHGFANEENRFDFYEEMERFLAEHLSPRRAPGS